MPEATPFRVLIVDDHPLMRRGISQLLQLDPAFNVVAEAGDGASAIDLANRLDLDVILLDLNATGKGTQLRGDIVDMLAFGLNDQAADLPVIVHGCTPR